MQKSGFIYIWYDRKHRRYYIGSHWGTEDDGYICSSNWMKAAMKRRPNDFKRKIITRITTNKTDLRLEEQKWLSMIKPEEIKTRYYNLNIKVVRNYWFDQGTTAKTIGEKISLAKKGKPAKWVDPAERGRKISETKKRKFQERFETTGQYTTDEHKKKLSDAHIGVNLSDSHRASMSVAQLKRYEMMAANPDK